MIVKTVKVSSKGQITLPAEILRALKAKKGSEFVVVQDAGRILLVPAQRVGKREIDEWTGWETLAEASFADLWDNPEDEVWNDA